MTTLITGAGMIGSLAAACSVPGTACPGAVRASSSSKLVECAGFGRTYRIAEPDLHRQGMDYTYSVDCAQALVRVALAPQAPSGGRTQDPRVMNRRPA